jgi:iron complex outermembrane receptor protein
MFAMTKIVVLAALIATAVRLASAQGAIAGSVVDAESGKGIPTVHVSLDSTGRGVSTDSRGGFLFAGLQAGTHRFRISCVGYEASTVPFTVAAGETLQVRVSLRPRLLLGSPVVVTALRGTARETPATFSTLSKSEIREEQPTQDIPIILSLLPSSTFYSESGNNIGYTYLNIRGFDSRRIAVLINGIPQNDPEDHNVYWLDFPDLAASLGDVQVQRGSGSAFYGPPAIGGSVNLVSNAFASERGLDLEAGGGSFNTRRYSASVNSGLVDNRYAFHARLATIRSDGYRHNGWTDFTSYFLGAIRYDKTMTTQVNFYGGPVADHLAYYGIDKADVSNRDRRKDNPIARNEEIENFSQPHYELFHEWRVSPALTLNTTLFYIAGSGFFDYDGSWAPYSYYRITPDLGFAVPGDPDTLLIPGALIRAYVSNSQFGWLPRVTLHLDDGTATIGAEIRTHRSLHWGRLQWASAWPDGVPIDYRYYQFRGGKDIISFYANEDRHLTPDLSVNASVQYAFNRYRLYDEKFLGTDFSVPYHFVNPRAGVNSNVSREWNTYVSIGYTSREPRLQDLYNAGEASTPVSWGAVHPQFEPTAQGTYDFTKPLVKPESLLDLEWGWGYATDGVSATANVYLMEFRDEIVKSGQVDRFGQPVTGNAERTRHLGIEASLAAMPFDGCAVSANATISRNRILRADDFSGGSALPLDGNPIAGFPDILANIRLRYSAGPLTLRWTVRSVGRQHTDNRADLSRTVDPFVVHDASLSCVIQEIPSAGALTATLYVNNVFDRLYAAYGEGDQFFVAAERNFFVAFKCSL